MISHCAHDVVATLNQRHDSTSQQRRVPSGPLILAFKYICYNNIQAIEHNIVVWKTKQLQNYNNNKITTFSIHHECTIMYALLPNKHVTLHQYCLMLANRLRHWPSIKPALVQRLVFAGYGLCTVTRVRLDKASQWYISVIAQHHTLSVLVLCT